MSDINQPKAFEGCGTLAYSLLPDRLTEPTPDSVVFKSARAVLYEMMLEEKEHYAKVNVRQLAGTRPESPIPKYPLQPQY
jgi:hypothetical protein